MRLQAAVVVAIFAISHQSGERLSTAHADARAQEHTTRCSIESRSFAVDKAGNADITWNMRVQGCPSTVTVTTGRFTYEVVITDTDGQYLTQERRTGWVEHADHFRHEDRWFLGKGRSIERVRSEHFESCDCQ